MAPRGGFRAGMVRANCDFAMKNKPLILALTSVAVLLYGCATSPTSAQLAVPPPAPIIYQPLSAQQLDQLTGPIALYPDPLLAVLLPAATLPEQIVMADRYVSGGGDPNLIDQQPWDPSVQALARYPTVLKYMDDNLDWTTALGQAFANQQQDVMDSIQRLRSSAQNFGNLVSTPEQQVVVDSGSIAILPVDPTVIYVPVYQPQYIFIQPGYRPVFGPRFTVGIWLNGDFNWRSRQLFFWDRTRPRPVNWWRQPPSQRNAWMSRQGAVWRPGPSPGRRPQFGGDRGYAPAPRPPAPRPDNGGRPPQRPDNNGRPPGAGQQQRPTPQPRPPGDNRPAPGREQPGNRPATTAPTTRPTTTAPANRPATIAPVTRPSSGGAFGGDESARDTRNASNRGQQSMQNVSRSAPPASRPTPSSQGGGSRGGGSQPRR